MFDVQGEELPERFYVTIDLRATKPTLVRVEWCGCEKASVGPDGSGRRWIALTNVGCRERALLRRESTFQRGGDRVASRDKIDHHSVVDEQFAFILALIAQLVASVENAPYLGAETEGMRKHLKHDIPFGGAISRATQCGKAERVRGVVSEIESTFERVGVAFRIGETHTARSNEPGPLRNIGRFGV